MEPEVIYENKDFIVINKPYGLLVHQVKIKDKNKKGKEEETLADWLKKKYPEISKVGDDPATRPGIMHRLDKTTSGIMVIARTQNAFEYLKSLFQKGEIKKTYLALVLGSKIPKEGLIDFPIGIGQGTLKRSIRGKRMVKEAVTEYKTIKTFESKEFQGLALLELKPRTGRTHQLRVHLSAIHHPIVGDILYGPKKQPDFAKRIMLHALSLEFKDPLGAKLKFEADPPEEFKNWLS